MFVFLSFSANAFTSEKEKDCEARVKLGMLATGVVVGTGIGLLTGVSLVTSPFVVIAETKAVTVVSYGFGGALGGLATASAALAYLEYALEKPIRAACKRKL